jgi:hypothetical protein
MVLLLAQSGASFGGPFQIDEKNLERKLQERTVFVLLSDFFANIIAAGAATVLYRGGNGDGAVGAPAYGFGFGAPVGSACIAALWTKGDQKAINKTLLLAGTQMAAIYGFLRMTNRGQITLEFTAFSVLASMTTLPITTAMAVRSYDRRMVEAQQRRLQHFEVPWQIRHWPQFSTDMSPAKVPILSVPF